MNTAAHMAYFSVFCLAYGLGGCSSDESKGNGGTQDSGPGATGGSMTGGSGGSSATGGSGGMTGGSGGTGGSNAGDAGVVTVAGKVVDVTTSDATKNFDATQYPALSGVEVCVYGDSSIPCVTTDANGEYTITGVPAGMDFYLSYTGKDANGADLEATLYAIVGAAAGATVTPPAILMTTQAFTDSWGTQGGVTPDATKGIILFGATTLGPSSTPFHETFGTTELYYLEGYSVTLSPAATAGPVFTSETWTPDPTLTVSSAAGWGFFLAAPGTYTLTITHPGMTCGSVTTKVVAGYSTTYVGTLCQPDTDGGTDAGQNDGASDAASNPG